MVFVLDKSGSVTLPNFVKMLNFVIAMVNNMDIGVDHVQIGAVTFSFFADLEFYLKSYLDKSSLLDAIAKIDYTSGTTNTAEALEFVREYMFQPSNGARENVTKMVIVITDGKSNVKAETLAQAELLKQTGAEVFALGIGATGGIDEEEINTMATNKENVFLIDNFEVLKDVEIKLMDVICKVNGEGFNSFDCESCQQNPFCK